MVVVTRHSSHHREICLLPNPNIVHNANVHNPPDAGLGSGCLEAHGGPPVLDHLDFPITGTMVIDMCCRFVDHLEVWLLPSRHRA